ncbi:MAG: CHAT domain-containing protein, partial [Vicinamibacterales bacterium]
LGAHAAARSPRTTHFTAQASLDRDPPARGRRRGRDGFHHGLLARALEAARAEGSLGYQAELTLRLGLLEAEGGQTSAALHTMDRASGLARAAGGNRILAGIALEQARLLRTANRASEAEATLVEGIRASRSMGERLILPQLLSQLADLRLARGQRGPAAALIREADDILEGLLTNASSPWARGRITSAMDGVVATRIRLEGSASPANPAGLLAAVERARARSLLELLYSRPPSDVRLSVGVREAERRIAALQLRLLRATARDERARLLAQIFVAEERLAPLSTELFTRAQRSARSPVGLGRIQAALRTDELFYEIALTEPASFGLLITTGAARVKQLPGRAAILAQADALASAARDGRDITEPAERMADTLLSDIPELTVRRRLILSLEGSLERMPFELLSATRGRRLLDTHVVSYTPSGSVLVLLRARPGTPLGERSVLAIGASPDRSDASGPSAKAIATAGNVFDVDESRLPQLPLATEEARQVGALFAADSVVLVNADATEAAVKAQPLASFRVVHFAAHGIVSTKDPARSAVLLKPSGQDDGLLQAREVLNLRFSAALVTLSACDTSAGAQLGQDGVASLVRPFLAAGAKAVVANLWSVDDTFSAALMKQFYGHLTKGKDIGEALRLAKLAMLDQFGPAATPQLWSGVLAYGDAAQRVVDRGTGAGTNGGHR